MVTLGIHQRKAEILWMVTLLSLIPMMVTSCKSNGETPINLKEEAIKHIGQEYHIEPDLIKSIEEDNESGLFFTITNKDTHKSVKYWVTLGEEIPIHNRIPQPDKKWNRLQGLQISGPLSEGRGWSKHLTDSELKLLQEIESTVTTEVKDPALNNLVREKVIPLIGMMDEFRKADLMSFVHAGQIHKVIVELDTQPFLGANLMGLTIYFDDEGKVLTTSKSILHAD